jgi:hypothetical protein
VSDILLHGRVFISGGVCVRVEGVGIDFEEIEHEASHHRGRYAGYKIAASAGEMSDWNIPGGKW